MSIRSLPKFLFFVSAAALFFLCLGINAQAACLNPSPLPSGYAAPCPVFSLSAASIAQSGSLGLTVTPQPGTDYIYTTAYYAKGSQWLPLTLIGSSPYAGYSNTVANGSLNSSILSTLPLGTNYVVAWDWLWDPTAQCYKGPGLNACNTGEWRIQTFNLTGGTTPSPTPVAYVYSQSAYTGGGCSTGCNNYYVSTTGSDANPCTQASPCKTITHAATILALAARV